MNTLFFRGLLLVFIVLMAACRTTPPAPKPLPQSNLSWADEILRHKKAVRAQPNWSFQGRVAFKQGNDGGSARIHWQQRDKHMQVDLSAPITRKSVRISALNGQDLCIDGLESERLCGVEAQMQLTQTMGEMPLFMLQDWVRGLSSAADVLIETGFQPAMVRYNDLGQLEWLSQQGWQVDYPTWHPATDRQPALPRRLEALKDDIRLRLVIDRWIWGEDE